MNGKSGWKKAGLVLMVVLYAFVGAKAQLMPPPDPFFELDSWSFNDTNWLSDLGYPPVSFANLANPPGFDGNALQVDATNAAWLHYNIVESDGTTNLTCNEGTVEIWVLPDWNSGTGPGDWGRIIDVGAYSTNSPSSWWSLYVSPDGNYLSFSSETNGVFTNYLSAPIAWDTNTWHLIDLTYRNSHSELYIDGQWVTNGPGVPYFPSPKVVSNGFFVGSDHTGLAQSRAQLDDLATYNYPLSLAEITNDYATGEQLINPASPILGGGSSTQDSGSGLTPPGSGGGGSSDIQTNSPSVPINYGAYLWIAQIKISSNNLIGIASNTIADVEYEVQSLTDLTQTNWGSQGFIVGSETTNWTPLFPITVNSNSNFFIRLRSWISSDGSGLPDWWELFYFGKTGIDPDALDSAGDGYTIWQKFKMGLNPNVFYSPPAPQGIVGNFTNSTATITWQPAIGPVTGYTITITDPNLFTWRTFTIGPTNCFIDTNYTAYPLWESQITYNIVANYSNGNSLWSGRTTALQYNTTTVKVLSGAGGLPVLEVLDIPPGASGIQVTWVNYVNSSSNPPLIQNTNVLFIPSGLFTNCFYTIPTNKEVIGSDGSSWYCQTVWSNGVSGISSSGAYAGHLGAESHYDDAVPGQFNNLSAQLEQNAVFLVRAAGLNGPFQYAFDPGLGMVPVYQPTNYAFAGFWDLDDYTGDGLGNDSLFCWGLPLEENYRLANFAYSSTNVNSSGFLNTGVDSSFDLYSPSAFNYSGTNTTAFPGLLTQSATTWIIPYVNPSSVGIDSSSCQFYLPNNITNYFGLKLISVLVAHNHNSALEIDTLNAGNSLTNEGDYYCFYPQYDQPTLQTVGYYFAESSGNYAANWALLCAAPIPGNYTFTPTNAQPALVAMVGTPVQIAAFAKQTILNGDTTKPVYVSQYFDKAYKVDASGYVTATQTGILSPCGYFTPTEPGPVALVTLPSSDGQRGTGVVQVASLVLDANHDGTLDSTLSGKDFTTPNCPMNFWVNDLYDMPGTNATLDKDFPTYPNQSNNNSTNLQPNYFYGQVRCQRNLENFARLWVRGVSDLPTNHGFSVTISVDQSTGNGVNLYAAAETDGGYGYLTDTNIAAAQVAAPYGIALADLEYNQTDYVVPEDQYGDLLVTNYLFEGTGVNEAGIVLSIYQNGNLLAQTEAYVNVDEADNLYEQAQVTNVIQTWPEMVQTQATSGFQVLSSPPSNPNEAAQLAVYVHGWKMSMWDYEDFSDLMYKRLYWQGYQGRFASLRWPTRSTDTDTNLLFNFVPLVDFTYNRSEHIAFESGSGASAYFNNLRQRYTNYLISACSHSMGGVVMMEALKELASSNQAPLNNYVLMQAAVPANCYDTTVTNVPLFAAEELVVPTPNIYGGYAAQITNALRGGAIDFYNPVDFALQAWQLNEGFYFSSSDGPVTMKPNTFFGYSYNATNSIAQITTNDWQFGLGITGVQTRVVTNMLEMMPFVARPRSLAVGTQGGVGNVLKLTRQLNLQATLGFTENAWDHSGQFNRNIQTPQVQGFYDDLLSTLFLQNP